MTATLPLDSERPFHNETEQNELNILPDKRTDFIKKLVTLTESGLPIHIAQAPLRIAAGSGANWHMRSMGIPSHVASEMDRVGGQAYQDILGVGDLTVAQAKRLFIPMREGGFGLASAELQAEPVMMASWASCAARVTRELGWVASITSLMRFLDCKEYTSKYRKFYAIWLRRKRQQQHEQ